MNTQMQDKAPRSPLGPLGKMEDSFEEFKDKMLRVRDCLNDASRIYGDFTALRDIAHRNAEETAAYLRNVLDEQAQLIDENEALQREITALRSENGALQARIEDLERQTEKRNFNVELRSQNETLLAQNEEMKRKRKKDLDARVAETRVAIFDTLREALEERDQLAVRFGNQNEWIRTLDLMRTMFRKLPDLTAAIDELLAQHLNQPVPTEKPVVTNIINQDIHDNTTVNA